MGPIVILAMLALEIFTWYKFGFFSAFMIGLVYLVLAALYVCWARYSRFSLFRNWEDADLVYSFIFPLDYGNQPWAGSDDQWWEVAIGWPFCAFCEIVRIFFLPFAFLGWIVSKLPKSEQNQHN